MSGGATGSSDSRPEPIELTFGDYVASVSPIGATLEGLTHRGRDLIVPFNHDTASPAYGGALLVPWPNRVIDARFSAPGYGELRLAVTEPARGHALHGLVTEQLFTATKRSASHVTMTAAVAPQQGYPWALEVETEFTLDERGLSQTVTATNGADSPAPYGTGCHPYLVAGPGPLDDWELCVQASRVQLTRGERLLPGEVVSVTADPSRFDFRLPHRLGTSVVDHAFTGLTPEPSGEFVARLTTPVGGGVEMVWDQGCSWVQLCTADTSGPMPSRVGLAVEPMTCPPDAFNSGVGLIQIAPGGRHTVAWRIAAIEAEGA